MHSVCSRAHTRRSLIPPVLRAMNLSLSSAISHLQPPRHPNQLWLLSKPARHHKSNLPQLYRLCQHHQCQLWSHNHMHPRLHGQQGEDMHPAFLKHQSTSPHTCSSHSNHTLYRHTSPCMGMRHSSPCILCMPCHTLLCCGMTAVVFDTFPTNKLTCHRPTAPVYMPSSPVYMPATPQYFRPRGGPRS
jgi:hypothetical protein